MQFNPCNNIGLNAIHAVTPAIQNSSPLLLKQVSVPDDPSLSGSQKMSRKTALEAMRMVLERIYADAGEAEEAMVGLSRQAESLDEQQALQQITPELIKWAGRLSHNIAETITTLGAGCSEATRYELRVIAHNANLYGLNPSYNLIFLRLLYGPSIVNTKLVLLGLIKSFQNFAKDLRKHILPYHGILARTSRKKRSMRYGDWLCLLEPYKEIAAAKNLRYRLTFTRTIASDLRPCLLDYELLETVVNNIMDNAIKYTDYGEISVSVYCARPPKPRSSPVKSSLHICLRISDTGIGISGVDQPGIFLHGNRGTNVGSRPGSGIGLRFVTAAMGPLKARRTIDSPGRLGGTDVKLFFKI